MKYLLFLLFVVGCAHIKPKLELHSYTCSSMRVHGSYANWEGYYENIGKAVSDAETINQRLIDSGKIPDSCIPICSEVGGKGISLMVGTSHRFKVGDCIDVKGSFKRVISEITSDDYLVLIGLDCTANNWIQKGCSRSNYSIESVDRDFEKIECSK